MQDEIDSLTASSNSAAAGSDSAAVAGNGGGGGGGSWNVTLADVCLQPLGSACATQSVLQYWGMSRDIFDQGGLVSCGLCRS
jgi:Niemann-Pick C1 protein